MSVTNLSSRQWYNNYMFNELNTALNSCTGEVYHINFTANGTSFSSITLNSNSIYYDNTKVYEKNDGVWGGAWTTSTYSFITIAGGADASDADLINFFSSAGIISNTMSVSLDLSGIELTDGTYRLAVKAIGDGVHWLDSSLSNSVEYTRENPRYDVSIASIAEGITSLEYSADGGMTWSSISGPGYIGNFSQICFTVKSTVNMKMKSPTLVPGNDHSMLSIPRNMSSLTRNYTLHQDVTDISIVTV